MNNLSIVFALALSTAIFLGVEKAVQGNITGKNKRLQESIRKSEDKRSQIVGLAGAKRKALERTREEAEAIRNAMGDLPAPEENLPFDPAHEGVWPSGKSYFYLPKALLPDLSFSKFNGVQADLKIDPKTLLILGITPEEGLAIERGWRKLADRILDLEVERLERTSTHLPSRWKGEKTSYRIPALENEIRPAAEAFFSEVRSMIGDSRAEIFNQWVKHHFERSRIPLGSKARIFTFTEEPLLDGRHLTRMEVADEDGKQFDYFELWHPPEFKFSPYRHLFGEYVERRHDPFRK